MKIAAASIFETGKKKTEDPSFCSVKEVFGVNAIYFDAVSEHFIESELGAVICLVNSDISAWVADYRHKEYWCSPFFGTDLSFVPDETQCLIYKTACNKFGVILPVVSEKYKAVLKGNGQGGVDIRLFSWYPQLNEVKALAAVYAEGDNPYELLTRCAAAASQLLGNGLRLRQQREYPEMFKYLGWCSWDAFEIRVDEKSLLAKCQEFKDKQIPVKWAILDDMWGEVRDFYGKKYSSREEMFALMHSSKLYSFNADPIRFPNGLKHCIEKINGYDITVGMWHPTTGYWMGIDQNGDIFKQLSDTLIKAENGAWVPSFEEEKAYKFYSAYHDYLKECGTEFVKIDNQSMTRRFYKNLTPVGEAARQFHNAIEKSVNERFNNQMINCMGLASEDMWNRPISPIVRCSDDFKPENREWFSKHILQCSYNSMLNGQFYYTDWDMWWTDDSQAEKNSLLRAISGGPIYISDTLDRSRKEILMPLCLTDGSLLMCDRPAMPTVDCLFENPQSNKKIFKLQNLAGESGVIAAFNIDSQNDEVAGKISPSDVEGLKGQEFALYEHFSKTLKCIKRNESLDITLLNNEDYKLYVIVPLKNGNGVIGNINKYISPKTFRQSQDLKFKPSEKGSYAFVENYRLILKEY